MQEKWKPIVDFEGFYEISDLGNVRSLDRFYYDKLGRKTFKKGQPIRPDLNKRGKGYYQVALSNDKIKKKWFKVHRLVCMSFLGVPEKYKELKVNHKNGITTDNRLVNLEWCTQSENVRHAIRTGLTPLGSDRPSSKLTEKDVKEIRKDYSKGNVTTKILGKKYGVSRHMIGLIINRKRWKHVKE